MSDLRIKLRSRSALRSSISLLVVTGFLLGTSCAVPESAPAGADVDSEAAPLREDTPSLLGDEPSLVDSEAALTGTPLRITMVDVGQGDGLVVQLPSGKVLVVDGGPEGVSGNFAKFLTSAGITQVDTTILSHAHSDHWAGLPIAIGRMPHDCVARVLDPGYDRSDLVGYRAVRDAAGCRYHGVGAGMSLNLDPAVAIEVLSFAAAPFPKSDSAGVNNTSVVLRIRYGSFSMLFSGDAETDAERALLGSRITDLKATVLKVGHHGSCNATGTTLLRKVAPKWAVISAATGNTFGHPHCQTIQKLKASGVSWMRTDKNGNITISTDGNSYAVTASKGKANVTSCPKDCAAPTDY
jgi:competence protein ComEC